MNLAEPDRSHPDGVTPSLFDPIPGLVAQAADQRAALVNHLVAMGCQVCGDPVETIEWTTPTMTQTQDLTEVNGFSVRITQQVRLRCRAHGPSPGPR